MSSDLSSKFHQISLNMREFSERKVYEFENFRLDADSLLLFRDGVQLPLTPKVVATLRPLVERHGEVVTKDDLMSAVWPDTQVEEGNLTQNLYLLRKTLGNNSAGTPFIETLRRRGYRFSAEVSLVSEVPHERNVGAPPVTVEKKANIYSVVDWQKSTADETATESTPPAISKQIRRGWTYPVIALLAIAVLGLGAFAVFRTSVGRAALDTANELTFDQLTDGRDVADATISPDGDYFTYHEVDGDVSRMFVQQVGQSNRIEIVPATTRSLFSKTFSPDGKFIYFVAAEKGAKLTSLYRVPTLGGVQTKILDEVGSVVGVSPDGLTAVVGHNAFVTRVDLVAGSIIGSGTVSNKEGGGPGRPAAAGGVGYSCIAEQRTVETILTGKATTPFMRFGDRIRIEMLDAHGRSVFGAIDQQVVAPA